MWNLRMWRYQRLFSHHTNATMLSIPNLSSQTLTIRSFRTLISLPSYPVTLFSPPQPSPRSPLTPIPCRFPHSFNSSPIATPAREFFGFSPNALVTKSLYSYSSSSTPSVSVVDTLECDEPDVYAKAEDSGDDVIDEDVKPPIPVRAYFFSTSVNLKELTDQNRPSYIRPNSRMTDYVVLRFGNTKPESIGLGASISGSDNVYMVVFQYGSVVLFNTGDHETERYLKIVKEHVSGELSEQEMRKDEYEVKEKPTLETWMEGGLNYIMLKYLNIDGIRIIGNVLGQSVALDYYVRQVDEMIGEFTDIYRGMEKTGTFTVKRKKLLRLVGKASSIHADVIPKLGLFERSDIAWKDAKYAQIWEYLKDEFELAQRFASLDFKLKFVEHSIRFLQELFITENRTFWSGWLSSS